MAKKSTKKAPKKAAKPKQAKKTVTKAKVPAKKKVTKKPVVKTPPAPTKPASKVIAEVEHLMLMMSEYGVTEINIEDGKRKIELKRGVPTAPSGVGAPVMAPAAYAPAAAAAPAAPAPAAEPQETLHEITSPMVGTFYSAPSPDSPAFAKVGTTITDTAPVCIVEAMKVMNEIEAECTGTIVEVCVKNSEPVEFGQVLFKVKLA